MLKAPVAPFTLDIVCMFDVAVQIRCRKGSMQCSPSSGLREVDGGRREWSTGRKRTAAAAPIHQDGHRSPRSRQQRAVAMSLPKNLIARTPGRCIAADGDSGGLLSHSFRARRRWDGDGLCCNSREMRKRMPSAPYSQKEEDGQPKKQDRRNGRTF
jgi:hypothetical protein